MLCVAIGLIFAFVLIAIVARSPGGNERSATVRADGDCYVMEISKDVMADVIRESPDCLRQLSELLANRKMETEGILKDAATLSADQAAKQREYTATFLNRPTVRKLSSRSRLGPGRWN